MADEIAKRKKVRSAHRGAACKLINKTNEKLNEDGEELEELWARQQITALQQKGKKLQELDDEVVDLLVAIEETTEDDIERVITEGEKLRSDLLAVTLKLEKELKTNQETPLNTSTTSTESTTQKQITARLPKLQMLRFNGKLQEWQEFWDSYESTIHKNEALANVDKFKYLKGLLDGPAKATVAGFALTSANYDAAVKTLLERYGRDEAIQQSHIKDLMEIEPVYNDADSTRLRRFFQACESHYRGLQALEVNENTYSCIVVPRLLEKLPSQLRLTITRGQKFRLWKMKDLIHQLKNEIELREDHDAMKQIKPENKRQYGQPRASASALLSSNKPFTKKCVYCWGHHEEEDCANMNTAKERRELLVKYNRCFKCLKRNHRVVECRSNLSCKGCGRNHHVSICEGQASGKTPQLGNQTTHLSEISSNNIVVNNNNQGKSAPNIESGNYYVHASTKVALQTAQGILRSEGESDLSVRARVLFDGGSHRSFITSSAAREARLPVVRREWLSINAFGESGKKSELRNVVELTVSPVKGKNSVRIEAFVVPEIAHIPNNHVEIARTRYLHLRGLWFSDVNRSQDKLEIDVLVGADYLWQFQKGSAVRGKQDEPVAIETELGWVLSGPLAIECERSDSANIVTVNTVVMQERNSIDSQLDRLWDLDSLGIRPVNEVHEEFSDNIEFTGKRYSVKLPWKTGHRRLPTNQHAGLACLRNQVKKLQKTPALLKEYDRIMREQLAAGIVEKVPAVDLARKVHYLPHHAVVREDALTTKVRIVYNGSSKDGKHGVSLNDCLHTGPSLNPLLLDILLRFRENRVALAGDIEKAFLNVDIDDADRDVVRFYWVEDVNKEDFKIETYRFTRVVFGLNASPFLLNATIRHHLARYSESDPRFTSKLAKSFYVDDLVTGEHTVSKAFELFEKSVSRMSEAGFRLRKWLTNSRELREKIECVEKGKEDNGDESYAKTVLSTQQSGPKRDKILGLSWDCERDSIHFNFERTAERAKQGELTKRSVLSVISGLFDPLGIFSPMSVSMKIMFQELCTDKVGWDEPINDEYKVRWNKWVDELCETKEIVIDRCVYDHPEDRVTECYLHGFGDASTKAYCAVVYLVYVLDDGSRHVKLLASKTRVAPLKQLTIPRLELMSAVILTQLVETVKNALSAQLDIKGVTYWLDSKTALCWIQNRGEWKQFVRHRVNSILGKTEMKYWRHCPGEYNPADIGSRGTSADALKKNKLWWEGPSWLKLPDSEWPSKLEEVSETQECKEEEKKSATLLAVNEVRESPSLNKVIDVSKYSDYNRLVRVTAWVSRFVNNLRVSREKRGERVNGKLEAQEISEAEQRWIVAAQVELKQQGNYKQLASELRLDDSNKIIVCRGRLEHSDLSVEARAPIILPKEHRLTRLIIEQCHNRVLHSGLRATLAELRAKFWVPRGRQIVKNIIGGCVTCKKLIGKPYGTPTEAALPEFRVKESPPFSKVGVDFAGPLYVKGSQSSEMDKVYIALFTCCVTRAVHLELVENLEAPTFMRCLRKFSARRGMPTLIVSDNAKTFQAANRTLNSLFEHPEVRTYLNNYKIVWRFNLAKAPWWGGFFERMVGNVKQSLRKVLGNARLTHDELVTVLTEVESTLNCRPLTYEYDEVGEEVLTPSHLIYGRRINSLPDAVVEPDDVREEPECSTRFKYLSSTLAHFWGRWRKEYLANLREFHKTKRARQSKAVIQVGDVVTVYEEGKKRNEWKLAVIEELVRGRDGVVRGAKIRVITKGKIVRISRPVQRLYPIEVRADEDDAAAMRVPRVQQARRTLPRRNAALDAGWKTRLMLDS